MKIRLLALGLLVLAMVACKSERPKNDDGIKPVAPAATPTTAPTTAPVGVADTGVKPIAPAPPVNTIGAAKDPSVKPPPAPTPAPTVKQPLPTKEGASRGGVADDGV